MAKANPILHLINDPQVTEIMINSHDQIFVERSGQLTITSARFDSERDFKNFIRDIMEDDGKGGSHSLSCDGIMTNGYRYNVVFPPMNPRGPSLTIRKFSDKKFTLDTLVKMDCLSDKAAHFLSVLVKGRINLVISGGTGAGKTTFLQALSSEIPGDERIVTIEDTPELKLHQLNWVQLLAVKEGQQAVSVRDCLVNSLRMRPDRIIVGECRRDEAFDMLQAMNSGHDGSMTSVHANSPVDCLTRLENLLHMVGFDVPIKIIRRQISDTVNFVVQLRRTADGRRVVTDIMELTGVESDVITRAAVFERRRGDELVPTGYVPKALAPLQQRGHIFPPGFFDPKTNFKRTG